MQEPIAFVLVYFLIPIFSSSQMSATFVHLLRQLNGKCSFWRGEEHSTHTPICILIHADQHSVTDLNISHLMEMPARSGEPLQMCISR